MNFSIFFCLAFVLTFAQFNLEKAIPVINEHFSESNLVKNGIANAVVLIVTPNGIAFSDSFGTVSYNGTTVKPDAMNSIYHIASITKTFTATLALQAVLPPLIHIRFKEGCLH